MWFRRAVGQIEDESMLCLGSINASGLGLSKSDSETVQ